MNPSYFQDATLVIAGHGSTKNPDSSAPTLQHAETIRRRGIFSDVICCFWKEEPFYRDVLGMVDSQDVFVVPNFISEGYFTRTVIPREMQLDGPLTRRDQRTIRYCEPVGSHARMTDLLLAEAHSVAPEVLPGETSFLIVGHGTSLDKHSAVAAQLQVHKIRATGLYAEVVSAYMEETPLIKEWDTFTSQPNVVIVPFFISNGLHSYQEIPVLLGIQEDKDSKPASHSEIFKNNPHYLRGRHLYYGGAIGTASKFADIILDQVVTFSDTPHASGDIDGVRFVR